MNATGSVSPTTVLSARGVSIWLDDLSRDGILSGGLASLIADRSLAGINLASIRPVASFFVSRVDAEIDKRLEAVGTDQARSLKGRAGIANVQRPLWASTGVKDLAVPDTPYVAKFVASGEQLAETVEKALHAAC